MIGNDGAAMRLKQEGSMFFCAEGFVTTDWRPERKVRKRLAAGDWAAWVAVLTFIGDRLEDAASDAREAEE